MAAKYLFSLLLITIITSLSNISAQGFLHTQGKFIYDGNNQEVILRGIGTGNWMLNEGYMMKTSEFAGTHTMFRELLTVTIGEELTETYYETWLDNHFTRRDVDSMKTWGFNSVRVAMHYKWFTLPIESEPVAGQDTWLEEGFVRIDSLLDWCGDNQMYLILDMHGAPGGQGHDRPISDYDPDKPSLWESAENRRKLTALWKKLAQRYVNEPWIIIEGNWFANDYTGLTPPWDDNIVYSFHKYWTYNVQSAIQWMIDIRNAQNVPIWLGETGENSNSWFTDIIKLAEDNKIGWAMWPVKKAGINNVLMVPESQQYNNLLSYWKTGSPNMTPEQAFNAVMDWADNHRIENCKVQRDVIDAMLRQPHSTGTLPYTTHLITDAILMVNYDLGKCSSAYWDADTANYELNTGNFVNWNEGWSYRNDGVDIQACTDNHPAGNGFNIAWTKDDEWLQYTVTSDSAAAYTVMFRSACASGPSLVHLQVNGTDVCTPQELPVTGGWQTWMSSTVNNVIIPAGTNKITFYFDKGGSNVNLFRFLNPVSISTVPFNFISAETNTEGTSIMITLNKLITSQAAQTSDFEVTANGSVLDVQSIVVHPANSAKLILQLNGEISFGQEVLVSYLGNSILSGEQVLGTFAEMTVRNRLPRRFIIPMLIQAEDFDVNNGFQLENCTDEGGGQNLGFANNGDYVDYNIYVPDSGAYTIRFRVASLYSNGSISIRLSDGTGFTTLRLANFSGTGGWQTWSSQSFSLTLPEGSFTLRIYSQSGEYNINWFEITPQVGIYELPKLKKFSVFPNPSHGTFRVEAEFSEKTPSTIRLYDLTGNLLVNYLAGKNSSFFKEFSHEELIPGVYFLSLVTEDGEITRKLILN
jgi:endoglucanase